MLSGTTWCVLQMMVSLTMNICKTDHWNSPLCYSRNKCQTTVQKGCRVVALRCRVLVCVQASHAKQNINNAFMRIFSVLFSFSLRYHVFDRNAVQSVMYCCEDSWRNMECTHKSKLLFSLWKAEMTCASVVLLLNATSDWFEQIRIVKEILSGSRLYFNWDTSLFGGRYNHILFLPETVISDQPNPMKSLEV